MTQLPAMYEDYENHIWYLPTIILKNWVLSYKLDHSLCVRQQNTIVHMRVDEKDQIYVTSD